MNRKFLLSSLSLFLIVFFGGLTQIFACSCFQEKSVCETLGEAQAVFVGEVIEAKATETRQRSFVFSVKQNFLGAETVKTVTIYTGSGGGDCGYNFEKGKTYLVYAYASRSGDLTTGLCTRTRSVTNAESELEELKSLRTNGARIYGAVAFWEKLYVFKDSNKPLSNFNLLVEQTDGERKKYYLTTDAGGNYELTNLPAGKYQIVPSLAAGLKVETYQTSEFSLNERGCARKDLYVKNDSFLKGKVIDGYEKPVVEIPIDLIPADLMPPDFNFNISIYNAITGHGFTVEGGEFSYKSVPPGKYFLAANLNYLPDAKRPYPATFYKAPGEKTAATVIEIGVGQRIENLIIQLPPPLPTSEIRGRVFWQNGKPAANVFVYLRDTEGRQNISNARTDKDGNFVLQGFAGRKYAISALAGDIDADLAFQYKARDIEFVFDEKTADFKLILESKTKE